MKTLTVALPGREYEIAIQRGLLSQAGERIRAVLPRARRLAVVTDTNVGPLYYNKVKASLERAGFELGLFPVPAGEKSKNAAQLSQLWEGFMEFGLTRTDGVVALGGGVVGDLAGFAAATILRGVAFVQIPTTLLAQVDSSVGGKVAVDLEHGKNLAGAFYQPRLVLMDPDALDTLPLPVFMDGMAEVVKYGCIRDPGFFEFLTGHRTADDPELRPHPGPRLRAGGALYRMEPRSGGSGGNVCRRQAGGGPGRHPAGGAGADRGRLRVPGPAHRHLLLHRGLRRRRRPGQEGRGDGHHPDPAGQTRPCRPP